MRATFSVRTSSGVIREPDPLCGRDDLLLAFGATGVPLVTGMVLGVVSGYSGGKIDTLIMRVVDVVFAFPFIVLVLTVIAILGSGLLNMLFAIWLVAWVPYTRLVRGEVLVAKNQEYVFAARSLGFSRPRVMMVHLLPNVAPPAFVYGAINAVSILSLGAALGFLGWACSLRQPSGAT